MRMGIANGNGALCDKCSKPLVPFKIYRMKGVIDKPGKNYPAVTSDITMKQLHMFHLCEDCYNKIVRFLENKEDYIQ